MVLGSHALNLLIYEGKAHVWDFFSAPRLEGEAKAQQRIRLQRCGQHDGE